MLDANAEEILGYSILLLGGAPYAFEVSTPVPGIPSFPIFLLFYALPAVGLLLALGRLSTAGPVLTFQRLAPIASGIGWALTWHIGERLFSRSLLAVQTLLYALFSVRTNLNWALLCDDSYDHLCTNFFEENVTHREFIHNPDNLWAAQQFNRYTIRGERSETNLSAWTPNEWYLDSSGELGFPSLKLLFAHAVVWTFITLIITRLRGSLSVLLSRFFVLLPLALYLLVLAAMFLFSFSFSSSIEEEIPRKNIEEDPREIWADLQGHFRSSLGVLDYCSAFTGLVLYASSRLTTGSRPLSALVFVPLLLVPPILLSLMRAGCEGHIAKLQPAYKTYVTTEGPLEFDVLAVCFATTSWFGPLWAFLFYTAQLLFTCIGPMIVFILFIVNTVTEQFPFSENLVGHLYILVCGFFAIATLVLLMPLGTAVTAFFGYCSQSSIVHILSFTVIYFIYGWMNIEADIALASGGVQESSFLAAFLSPTSPFCTALLFIVVPGLLASKFTAVFDFLFGGNDLMKHISAGVQPLGGGALFKFMGVLVMFFPLLVCVGVAGGYIFRYVHINKMPFSSLFQPTSDWLPHSSVVQKSTKTRPLASRLLSVMCLPSRSALFVLFLVEIFFGIVLAVLFLLNAFFLRLSNDPNNEGANNFRTLLLLFFLAAHVCALIEMRWLLQRWDFPSRLNVYIAVATWETAFLNGYMWMFTSSFEWGLNGQSLALIVFNSLVRGACIMSAIGIRWDAEDARRPSRMRDASEVYDAQMQEEEEREDDTPIIFELARA